MPDDQTALTEEDIKQRFITPALHNAGWETTQLRMEYVISDGQIMVEGAKKAGRAAPKKADYLLSLQPNIPLAVLEAKSQKKTSADGIQQAIGYAQKLDVPFAYSSNGIDIIEHDFLTGQERTLTLSQMPGPKELWRRVCAAKNYTEREKEIVSHPYYSTLADGALRPRYYQTIAINRTVEAVARGQKRLLLVMATGTGKTFTAFHIIWRLRHSSAVRKVLYLADRNCLIDQSIKQDFKPFHKILTKITHGTIDTAFEVYMGLYQQLAGDDDTDTDNGSFAPYRQVSPEFFDLIIVDECHRGSARANSAWREILEYFSGAIQLGLTATPKETDDVSTTNYFGAPLYTYSLKQGIQDGFLAPYRVITPHLDIDVTGIDIDPGQPDVDGAPMEGGHYDRQDMDKSIIVDARTAAVARRITNLLQATNRMDKTIVFCVNTDHAARMRTELIQCNTDMVQQNPEYIVRITGNDETGKNLIDKFIDKHEAYPVIATTSQLLSTGVDTKTCKLIVIDKEIGSQTEFKQIIGRGSRLVPDKGKYYFTILDFRGACRHFMDPDFDGDPIPNPNFEDPVDTERPDPKEEDEPLQENRKVVRIRGKEVSVLAETVQYLDNEGRLTTESLIDYSRRNLLGEFETLDAFLHFWTKEDRKTKVLEMLREKGVLIDALREAPGCADFDELDILCRLAWDAPPKTRKDRAARVRKEFFEKYSEPARRVLEALLERYAQMGVTEMEDATVLRLPPFSEIGPVLAIVELFGGKEKYRQAINDLERVLYAA